MNSNKFVKEINIKLNKLKSKKSFRNLINKSKENPIFKILKESQLIKYFIKSKYIIPTTILIFSGGLFYLNFLNKNNLIVKNETLPKVAVDSIIEQTKKNDVEVLKIEENIKNNFEVSKIEEESAIDLLSPLISPSELDLTIPKGRLDPFNKTNVLSLGDSNDSYLDLEIYGVISVEDRIYALSKSKLGSALICPTGRGKCDKFSSNVIPIGWELIDIDINTGCANFVNKKAKEKSICMSSL
tara:strand:- start:1961 stop:2686 length:726 start_codon:yes stop_codon:yes gene_type:complete